MIDFEKFWPVVYIRTEKEYRNDDQLQVLINEINHAYQFLSVQPVKCFLYFDTVSTSYIDPSLILPFSRFMTKLKPLTEVYVVSTIIVVENFLIRNVVDLFFRIFVPARPQYTVKNNAEGLLALATIGIILKTKFE